MLRKLWAAEKAAWAAWRRALRPVVEAVAPADPLPVEAELAIAAEIPVMTAVMTVAPAAPPADASSGHRWTLYDSAGSPCQYLHGMTQADLDIIRTWPGRKWDSLQKSWR